MMGGKVSILMVLAFSGIFMIAGSNFGSLTRRAVSNEVNYYVETMAHDIAVSAANIASNMIFLNNNWATGYQNVSFNGGTFDVNVNQISSTQVKVTAIGTYRGIKDTIVSVLEPMSFAQFGYYMNLFPGNLFFYTGDTISGPFHTQQQLRVQGRPVFTGGLASAKLGLKKLDKWTNPVFDGGFKSGVDIPFNWDVSSTKSAAQSGGRVFNSGSGKKIDVKLYFNSNGTVTYSMKEEGGSWSPDSTKSVTDLAPNGVIYIEKGNVYTKGTINGQFTVVADQSSGNGSGNVYLEDDIIYHNSTTYVNNDDDPIYPKHSYKVNGNDMLGIIASNNVIIKNTAANYNNINIHASLFCYKGGLTLDGSGSYSDWPYAGYIRLIGGLIEYQAQVTGVASGGSIIRGYNERIYFDQRFREAAPPYYPTTGKLTVVSWYESTYIPEEFE